MLPDFTRIAWVSPKAQTVWGQRVSRVSRAWEQIERLSVLDGLRSSALQNVAPHALPALSAWASSVGLHVVLLERVGVSGEYASAPVPLELAPSWAYRVAVAMPASAPRWPEAWRTRDDEAIGKMLGFPSCCRQFFARTWGAGMVDTTAEMGEPVGPLECNILLRWLGVRAVTHLPCSFSCAGTATRGKDFIACGRRNGFAQEMDWLEEMLDWPVEWSALHGIAEIVTPVCRIQTRTNPGPTKAVIRREGARYPAEGVKGTRFPFRKDCAEAKPLPLVDHRECTDNGFQSKSAMDAAHSMLLALLSGPYRCVLDLGCGNGALLAKIPAARRVGVESDDGRALRAFDRVDHVYAVDCTNPVALALILKTERPDLVIAQAIRNPPHTVPGDVAVLSYSYDEPAFARLVAVPERMAV